MVAYTLDMIYCHQRNVLFHSLLLLKILLNISFYNQTLQHLSENVIYRFTRLGELTVSLFCVLQKNSQSRKDGVVLGCPIKDFKREILLREY